MRPRCFPGFGAASGVALCAAGLALRVAGAQEPPPRVPDLVIPVSTELVRIDVVVTDKGGRPKTGLQERDFVVLEDGQPQPIAQFDAIVTGTRPTSGPTAGAAPDAEGEPPARATPTRCVVLAVDDVHIEASSLLRMKKAIDRFIEREAVWGDLIALVTTTGNHHHDFTDDPYALRRAVSGLSVQERALPWTDAPYVTEYQAEKIQRGDPEALRVAVEEIQNVRLSGDPEAEARSRAQIVHAECVNNARMTLESLDRVVRGLSGLPGRKVVVLLSDGFLAGLTTDGTASFDIRRITDAGTRAGVVLYALDTRGLVATSAGRSASSRMPILTSVFGARDNLERESEHATREAMSALVADSGGFLVQGGNDLGAGLRRILKDTETYYAVAYEPTNTKRDGAFHKIEVRLPGVRDVRIRARKGYFAPDDRKLARSVATPGAPVSAPPARERLDSEIRKVLTAPELPTALPVQLSADFVNMDGVGPQVVVSSRVDLNAISFARENQHRLGTVETAAAVFDESGAMVTVLEAERAAMDLTEASYTQALRDGLQYRRLASVRPGRYQVRLAVREEGTGKQGGASQWIQVPDLADGRLALSNLFLLREAESPPGGSASASDAPVLQATQAWRRFKRGEKLYVQVFAYNPGKDESGATSLVAQAEIWRGGVFLAASAPDEMPQDDRGAPQVEHTRSIKLEPFPPGDYEVRIVITDQNSRQMTSRQAAFVIE